MHINILSGKNNYYEKILGIDYDMPYVRKKWNMNYMNMFPNPNLVANIKEPVNEKLNILEIGCDCGATLCIQKGIPLKFYIWYKELIQYQLT